MPDGTIQAWKIQMDTSEFIVTVYTADEEKTVNALIDNGADPESIRVTRGSEPDTVNIRIVKEGDTNV